jgi:FemAB-related protein (PEP-CTERM system-associated)
MILPNLAYIPTGLEVLVHQGEALDRHRDRFEAFMMASGDLPLTRHPAWLGILRDGLRHVPYCLEVAENGRTRGLLPLAFVRSLLFGKFLVSLPYLNDAGVLADDEATAHLLVNRAVRLADELDVRYLELRHQGSIPHPYLLQRAHAKVHMRRPLPSSVPALWQGLDAKVRNQVRKGQKSGLSVSWGGRELLSAFYAVFSHNMRDLGTPVYSPQLFAAVLREFPDRAEFCVVRHGDLPVAAALLLHGWGVSEVPSASSLRPYNHLNANMLLYWQLLERAVERGQGRFDFGRSTPESNTYRFKKQWGGKPEAAGWQYYLREGTAGELRPDNPRYQPMIRLWQRLPVGLTRLLGPSIVRGIP